VSEQNLNSRQMYDSAVEPYNGQINTKLCNDELNHKRKKKERRRNLWCVPRPVPRVPSLNKSWFLELNNHWMTSLCIASYHKSFTNPM